MKSLSPNANIGNFNLQVLQFLSRSLFMDRVYLIATTHPILQTKRCKYINNKMYLMYKLKEKQQQSQNFTYIHKNKHCIHINAKKPCQCKHTPTPKEHYNTP